MAAIAAFSAAPFEVLALGLGRLNVQSALGEGMRAEIDITSLSPEEASTLVVRIASPEAYRAAGVDYNAVLSATQATVARRADGRPYLRVSSDRAVQEPFIEVIVEMNSASGRQVREFTLLFDPPGSRNAPPAQATAPVATVMGAAPNAPAQALDRSAAPSAAPRLAPVARQPAPSAVAALPSPSAVATAKPIVPKPLPAPRQAEAPQATAPNGRRYQVRGGDTLYRVAARNQQAGVALDQMLVGLYRANPDAFIENNVNKLRAGAVLTLPSADEVRDLTSADARRLISAQSADFSAYRTRLAQSAPLAQAPDTGRQAQGRVEASVDDRKQSAAPSPDKLKLSGGAVKASAPEASSAASAKDNGTRVAELTRNVDELKKLQQGAAAAQQAASSAAVAPAAQAALPAPVASMAQAAASVVAPASAVTPAVPVQITPPVRPPVVAPAMPPAPEPSVVESITGSSWLLPGAGVLALLLAGFAAWRLRGRFAKTASETSFLESRMQPDSFFGASGGQRIDTREAGNSNASTMGYSLSQLDAIGDVDPVAEADVYLAYGRDLQAEEILIEAMRASPERLAVRTKLLEVYAKRRDTKGFELLATQLYALTKGMGTDWARAQELGRPIDPDNQLYQPGGHPEEIILDGERVVVEPLGAPTQPYSEMSQHTRPHNDDVQPSQFDGATLDLDLDLDLDAAEAVDTRFSPELTRPMASSPQHAPDRGVDFDFGERTQPPLRAHPPGPRTVTGVLDLDSLAMDIDDRGFTPSRSPASAASRSDATIDFNDFPASLSGSLSGMLRTTPGGLDDLSADGGDPLARKLELAEEFRQIGDLEGARDLLEEVVAKASGTLRAKARAMLEALG